MIILTWNGLKHLQTFLPSVVRTDYPDFEIILADNCSSDGSYEWVRKHYPDVIIASLDDNYGYTGGNNRAVPYAKNEILVFLNNDVEVHPDWLTGLNKAFETTPDLAVAQPKLLSYTQRDHFEYAGAAGGYLDRFGYPFCRGRVLDTVEKDIGQYDTQEPITWASGAAMAVNKEVFIASGGFDEDFELHMEEIDLCWRLLNSGHQIVYVPDSVVYHLGGGSLPTGSERKVFFNFRNNLFMLLKNLPATSLIPVIGSRLILDHIAAIRALILGHWTDTRAIWRAHIHFWIRFRRFLKKRTGETNTPVRKKISLTWQYFIRGKRTFGELMQNEYSN